MELSSKVLNSKNSRKKWNLTCYRCTIHPSSNGMAKRVVWIFKEVLRNATWIDQEAQILRFLLMYQLIPHSTTGNPPAELLLGQRSRSCLDLMQPNMAEWVYQGQNRKKLGHDQHAWGREFSLDGLSFGRNFAAGSRTWLLGTVVGKKGPFSLDIELEDGQVLKRHINHLRVHLCEASQGEQGNQLDNSCTTFNCSPYRRYDKWACGIHP